MIFKLASIGTKRPTILRAICEFFQCQGPQVANSRCCCWMNGRTAGSSGPGGRSPISFHKLPAFCWTGGHALSHTVEQGRLHVRRISCCPGEKIWTYSTAYRSPGFYQTDSIKKHEQLFFFDKTNRAFKSMSSFRNFLPFSKQRISKTASIFRNMTCFVEPERIWPTEGENFLP